MNHPSCKRCRFQKALPLSARVEQLYQCRHPNLSSVWENPLSDVFSISGGAQSLDAKDFGLTVSILQGAVKSINHSWPYSIDSDILKECSGYSI